MIPLTGSGTLQFTLIESDERGSAETSLGADGAEERVMESHNKSWMNRAITQHHESHVVDNYIHKLLVLVILLFIVCTYFTFL